MAELLVPVASSEHIKAAVAAGADALLVDGLSLFGNNDAFLRSVIFDCRRQGVRVYFDIKAPLSDGDNQAYARSIARAALAGADALIVNSPGSVAIARNVCPGVPLFAGSGMAVTDITHIQALREMGLSRVTPAKELNHFQLEYLKKYGSLPLMVTVHDEMCMSFDGQCHASIKNNGQCGDFCRSIFAFSGTGRRRNEYPLSLKGLSLASKVRDLIIMGIDCLVIGKSVLKSTDMISSVTAIYARIMGEERFPRPEELRILTHTLVHGGVTDAFYEGKPGPDMQGRPEAAEYAARLVFDADALIPLPQGVRRRKSVRLILMARKDRKLVLAAEDSLGNRTVVTGSVPSDGYEGPRQNDTLRLRLSSVTDRQFRIDHALVDIPVGLSVDPDEVERMQRRCLDNLRDRQKAPAEHSLGRYVAPQRAEGYLGSPQLILSYRTLEQIDQNALSCSPQYIYLPVDELIAGDDLTEKLLSCGIRLAAVLPVVITDHEVQAMEDKLNRLHSMGVEYAVVGSLTALAMARDAGFVLRGDFGLNLRTSFDLEEAARWGLASASILYDVNFDKIAKLQKTIDTEILAYGRIPLMLTENCISRNHYGLCDRCESLRSIVDRSGEVYPIVGEPGCRNLLLDSQKVYLADRMNDLGRLGVRYLRLSFTTENRSECAEIIQNYYQRKGKPMVQRPWRGAYYQNQ